MAVAEKLAMTLQQAAAALQVPADDLERWLEAGEVPGARLPSGEWRIPRSALEAWLHHQAQLNLQKRPVNGREALRRADELRARILARRGGKPFPHGFGVQAIREARGGD